MVLTMQDNYANPVYGVVTIWHQVRCLHWGHPSLFYTVTSLLILYKMFCMRDISYRHTCRGVTIRLATIRYISRYTTHDMVHDTIQNQLIYYQWKILKHCGMCHQYCYIKTVILARNSEFKINKDVHNHPCPKYLLLTNCVCKQNNKIL